MRRVQAIPTPSNSSGRCRVCISLQKYPLTLIIRTSCGIRTDGAQDEQRREPPGNTAQPHFPATLTDDWRVYSTNKEAAALVGRETAQPAYVRRMEGNTN